MSQDEYISSRFSTRSPAKKNQWKFSKPFKKWAELKFLKHISDQEIREVILQNNPLSSNFLSRQKLDDYLLEIYERLGRRMKSSQTAH